MKKEQKIIDNKNGTTTVVETIETTPEDGFVHSSVIRPTKLQHYGKGNTMYHKGYSKTFSYTTNDPRITRPFVYGICGLFFVIGLIISFFGLWIMGIIFMAMSVFTLVKSKKDIDKISEELKQKGYDVTVDSVEEKEQLKKEVKDTISAGFKDATSSVFTNESYNWFMKYFKVIYGIILFVIPILLGIIINIYLGLFIFILLLLVGMLYYYIISKIFKKLGRK